MDRLNLQKEYKRRTQNLKQNGIEDGISKLLAIVFIKEEVDIFCQTKLQEIKKNDEIQ